MTLYEKLIASGPQALAAYVTERKIDYAKKVAKARDDIDLEVDAETYEKSCIMEFRKLAKEAE